MYLNVMTTDQLGQKSRQLPKHCMNVCEIHSRQLTLYFPMYEKNKII